MVYWRAVHLRKFMSKLLERFNKIYKYLVAAVILAVPLYPKFPFIRVPGTFVSIRLEDFLIGLTAVVCVLLFAKEFWKFAKEPVVRAMGLYLAAGTLSVVSAIALTQTVDWHIAFLHLARRVEYFIPFFIGFFALKNKRADLEFYAKLIVVVVLISFVYGFGQRYFSWPIIITQNQEYSKGVALRWVSGSHINSTFAGHYDLATFLMLVMPILITLFFVLKGKWTRVVLFLSSITGMWLLVNTASRISLVSYLIASGLALFFVKRYKAIPIVLVLSILFIGFSSNLLARYGRLFEVAKDKVFPVKINLTIQPAMAAPLALDIKKDFPTPTPPPPPVFEDRSTSIRLNVEWPRAFRAFLKNPFLGTGYSSITLATDNDYLRLLGEVGLLGFLLFTLIFVRMGEVLLKVFPFAKNYKGTELGLVAGFVGSLPGIFLNAVFIDVFEASKFAILFWLIAGMVISLVLNRDYE